MKSIITNLETKDWAAFVAIILVITAGTYVVDSWNKSADSKEEGIARAVEANMGTVYAMTAFLIVAILISYYCVRIFGGTVGKGFAMFMWGFVFQLSLPIEVYWHLQTLPDPVGNPWLANLFGGPIFDVIFSSYWWLGFFHAAIAVSLALMGYGFYMLVRDLDLMSGQ